jgi:hypothetical protein
VPIVRDAFPRPNHLRTHGHHVAASKATHQTVEMWPTPDFSPLTPQRDKQVFIGDFTKLADVPAPTPEHCTAHVSMW